jgi:formate dehydrogenase maturation protein FdhE
MNAQAENHNDECPLCGGTGEVSISKDGTHEGTDYYGCPVCISRERDEEEFRLRKANLDCVEHFNAIKAERNELLAVLKELQESASYWSEYDVPLGIVDRIHAVIAKAEA